MSNENKKVGKDTLDQTAAARGLDRNPDPITGAPGSHPIGTAVGSAGGAAAGAAIGAVGGPVGAIVGGVAGAVVGAVAGHKAGEAKDPTTDMSAPAGTKHKDPVAAATNPKPGNRTVREANRTDGTITPD